MVITKTAAAILSFLFAQYDFREQSLALAKRVQDRVRASRLEAGMTRGAADLIMGRKSYPRAMTLSHSFREYPNSCVSITCKFDHDVFPPGEFVNRVHISSPVLEVRHLKQAFRWLD